MDRRLVSGGAVLLVGTVIGVQMAASSLRLGVDWVLRTGWVGLVVGAGLCMAGGYIVAGSPYELLVRALCVGWATVVGGGLALWTAIGVAATGDGTRLAAVAVVAVVVYLAILVPTALDIYAWYRGAQAQAI